MAYFLDPALDALARGTDRSASSARKVTPNRFAKDCSGGCGAVVPAGKGRLEKKAGAWQVYHLAC